MPRILLSLVALALLASCASSPQTAPVGRLSLESPVTIPPGSATLRLQYGRVAAFNGVQEQDPFCIFELETVSEQPQAVSPARFDISRVNRSIESFAGMPVLPFRTVLGDPWDDHQPSQIYYKTTFRLAPNPQGARALTCLHNQAVGYSAAMRHVTMQEMRHALGRYFALDLRGPL